MSSVRVFVTARANEQIFCQQKSEVPLEPERSTIWKATVCFAFYHEIMKLSFRLWANLHLFFRVVARRPLLATPCYGPGRQCLLFDENLQYSAVFSVVFGCSVWLFPYKCPLVESWSKWWWRLCAYNWNETESKQTENRKEIEKVLKRSWNSSETGLKEKQTAASQSTRIFHRFRSVSGPSTLFAIS